MPFDSAPDRPLAIDLFTGLHGWGEALAAEGWTVIGFDLEDMRAQLGLQRPENVHLVIQDVRTLHGSQFRTADLLVASPPCTEFSWMAMPWSRAKKVARALRGEDEFPEGYRGSRTIAQLTELFDACFRIQREAIEAAGRHIPLIVENVRGAQPWVGKARWAFGSFYLFGDVPALMPITLKASKVPGFRFDGSGGSLKTASVEQTGVKVGGLDWKHPDDPRHRPGQAFNPAAQGQKVRNLTHIRDGAPHTPHLTREVEHFKSPARVSENPPAEGRKGAGAGAEWFDQNTSSLPSASPRRKAASALIAKIPFQLASWIAKVYYPKDEGICSPSGRSVQPLGDHPRGAEREIA